MISVCEPRAPSLLGRGRVATLCRRRPNHFRLVCACGPQCNQDEESAEWCRKARVPGTPTWVLGGTALGGVQAPEDLSAFIRHVDSVADRLAAGGAVMYGRDGCSW